MFGILKKKLQDVISRFAGQKEKEIEKEPAPEQPAEQRAPPAPVPPAERKPAAPVVPLPPAHEAPPAAQPAPARREEQKPALPVTRKETPPAPEIKAPPAKMPARALPEKPARQAPARQKEAPKQKEQRKPAPLPEPKPAPKPAPKVEQRPAPIPVTTPEPAAEVKPAIVAVAEEKPLPPPEVKRPEPLPEKKQILPPEKKKEGFLSRLIHREPKEEKPKAEKPREEQPVEKPAVAVQEGPAQQPLPRREAEESAIVPPEEEPRTLLAKVKASFTTKTLSKAEFEKLFEELELAMLENSVALEVVERIKLDLEKGLVGVPLRRGRIEEAIAESLARSIRGLFVQTSEGLIERILSLKKKKRPVIVVFVGVNGCGKTTTIAKLAKQLKDRGVSSVMAAGDTFRAAAIHQLEEHATKLGIKLIKHDYGSDPAAVAFDAVRHAEAKGVDVVLIDTSGRMHSKANLMEEMGKIMRVAKPDLKVFVGEATVGNDAVEQAKSFNEVIDFDGIVLAKADIDEKGGAAISVSYVTGKPILALGTGQGYDDLVEFDSSKVLESLGLGA